MSTVTFSVARNDIKNVVDEDGDLSQVAVNVPSFEYNADGTYKGMLVESTSQNEIRNSEGGGSTNGVIGSGGVLPTNWGTAGLSGIAVEVIGTGTEKGVEYVDIKFSGTATATGVFSLRFESTSQISAAQNEFWSSSVFMKYTDQTANPESVSLGIQQFSSTPTFLASDSQAITLTNTLTRYKFENVELDNASTASIINTVFFGITNTETYNFTVRFGLPQLEESKCVTSVIKTTSAAVERVRDEIKNTSATTYIGQTSGTIYTEVQVDQIVKNGNIIRASDATDASNWNVRMLIFNGSFIYNLNYGSGNSISINTTASTGNHKLALVYTDGDTRAYLNGSQVSTTNTTSWGDFTSNQLDTIDIGVATSGTEFNNWIRAFAFYKRALTDNEAKILTQ